MSLPRPRRRVCLSPALLFVVGCTALPAAAGLSVEAMQQRHRDALAPAPTSSATLQLGRRPSTAPTLVGETVFGGSAVAASTLLLAPADGRGLQLRLGAVARDDEGGEVRLEGSSATLPAGPGELYASYEQRHWGPAWFGSLILDASAAPLAAIGWRSRPDAGADARWQWDLFAGRLGGHAEPAHPALIGMRLQWRPTRSWTLGLARTLQWGGRGRDESVESLLRALTGRDNRGDDGVTAANEPGNQLAGLDLRYDLRLERVALGAYGQLVGEDEAGLFPSRKLGLVGLDAATSFGATSLSGIAEYADTTAGAASSRDYPGAAYRHPLYPAGYTHRGRLLGHPVGGDARLASLALLAERGPLFAALAAHAGRARTASQLFVDGDRLVGADLALQYRAAPGWSIGATLQHWRAGERRDDAAQLWLRRDWR